MFGLNIINNSKPTLYLYTCSDICFTVFRNSNYVYVNRVYGSNIVIKKYRITKNNPDYNA